ncbi:hypothetical protein N8500_02880 [Candidatus Puniceispirillum sp.]|nr:hypothetical protein [Candidatus Puniceispirillum sp.]
MSDPSPDQFQNQDNSNISWQQRATMILANACQAKQTITYTELVHSANVPKPHRIDKLTTWLESTMCEDNAAGTPLRAALVISRNRGGIPAPGFFMLCDELGLYHGPPNGPEATQFHNATITDLFFGSNS